MGLRALPQVLNNPKGGGGTHRFSGRYKSRTLHSKTNPRQNVTKTILGVKGLQG